MFEATKLGHHNCVLLVDAHSTIATFRYNYIFCALVRSVLECIYYPVNKVGHNKTLQKTKITQEHLCESSAKKKNSYGREYEFKRSGVILIINGREILNRNLLV